MRVLSQNSPVLRMIERDYIAYALSGPPFFSFLVFFSLEGKLDWEGEVTLRHAMLDL